MISVKKKLNKLLWNFYHLPQLTLLSLTACKETHSYKLPRLLYSIIELFFRRISISSLLHFIWFTMHRWNCSGKSIISLSTTHSLKAPITITGRYLSERKLKYDLDIFLIKIFHKIYKNCAKLFQKLNFLYNYGGCEKWR